MTAKEVDSKRLSLEGLVFNEDATRFEFKWNGQLYSGDRSSSQVEPITQRTIPFDEADPNLSRERGIVSSGRSDKETSILFLNHLPQPIELFWIDAEGRKRSYGRLGPGEERDQHTFAGHVWEAIDLDGKSWGRFRATAETAIADIRADRSDDTKRPERPRSNFNNFNRRRQNVSPGWEVVTENFQLVLKTPNEMNRSR